MCHGWRGPSGRVWTSLSCPARSGSRRSSRHDASFLNSGGETIREPLGVDARVVTPRSKAGIRAAWAATVTSPRADVGAETVRCTLPGVAQQSSIRSAFVHADPPPRFGCGGCGSMSASSAWMQGLAALPRDGADSTTPDTREGLFRTERLLVAAGDLTLAARVASSVGHVVQYSRGSILHRGHGLNGRSAKRRTAAMASLPLWIGPLTYSASRSARRPSTEISTAPRSRAQVRQRYSTVSTGSTNSMSVSSGARPRSKHANAAAAASPMDVSSGDAERTGDFVMLPGAIPNLL